MKKKVTKKPSVIFDFVKRALKRNPRVSYVTVRDRWKKTNRRVKLWPITYGRAVKALRDEARS